MTRIGIRMGLLGLVCGSSTVVQAYRQAEDRSVTLSLQRYHPGVTDLHLTGAALPQPHASDPPARCVAHPPSVAPALSIRYTLSHSWMIRALLEGPYQRTLRLEEGPAEARVQTSGQTHLWGPGLTMEWYPRWDRSGRVHPYVGAGVQVLFSTGSTWSAREIPVEFDKHVGVHLQCGLEVSVAPDWSLEGSLRVLPLTLKSDTVVWSDRATQIHLTENPWVYGIGIRYHF